MTLDISQAMRMAGLTEDAPEALKEQLAGIAEELTEAVTPRYVWRVFSLVRAPAGIELPQAGLTLTGRTAETMLSGCTQAALLACTLGAGFDAMLRRAQAADMGRALLLDACGSAWVEAGCDRAEEELRERLPGLYLTDRFSPGYGDLPLALQPALCAAVDAPRRLGLSLSESFLLNPVKSVTAVVGIAQTPQPARIRGCAHCSIGSRCTFRKEGTGCGL